MSRILASVALAMLVLTAAMGLRTVASSHGDSSFLVANSAALTPVPAVINGPDPAPAPWKKSRINGPDPAPAPWK
jgi:hypothetical protein